MFWSGQVKAHTSIQGFRLKNLVPDNVTGVTPRLSETPLFRTYTSINRNGGVSLFFQRPLHSETPPLRTNITLTHFRNVRVRLEVGISAPRIAVFNFGTAVVCGEGRNSGVSEWGVSEWRGVAMEVCRN